MNRLRICALALVLAALAACVAPKDMAPPHDAQAPAHSPATSHADETGEASTLGEDLLPPPSPASRKADATARASGVGDVDYACTTDAQCTVKNVGNCCGYYPACVNVDSPTFPEQVKAACAESGTAGICGFPSISACQCVEGRCEGVNGPTPPDPGQTK